MFFNKHRKITVNDQKTLNINDLLNSIKVQYGLLNINPYDVDNLNQTAQQLFWIENDIDSDEYSNIQKQINYISKTKSKAKTINLIRKTICCVVKCYADWIL